MFSTSMQSLWSENLHVNPRNDSLILKIHWFGIAKSWTVNASNKQHLKQKQLSFDQIIHFANLRCGVEVKVQGCERVMNHITVMMGFFLCWNISTEMEVPTSTLATLPFTGYTGSLNGSMRMKQDDGLRCHHISTQFNTDGRFWIDVLDKMFSTPLTTINKLIYGNVFWGKEEKKESSS